MVLPIQPDMGKGQPAKLADRGGPPSGDHIIIRHILLQHRPHRLHIVPRMSPIPRGVQIAERQLIRQPQLDARHPVRHLAGHELDTAQRALMIEQNPRGGMQPEALPVIHRHPMRVELGHGIGAARIERRPLALHRLLDLAEHLRGRRLIEPRLRTNDAHRLQHVRSPKPGHGAGEQRLLKRGMHKALRRKIVDLVRLHLLNDADAARQINQIAIMQLHLIEHADPAQSLTNDVSRRRSAQQAMNPVALAEQQSGEIGAILAGNTCDQCYLHTSRLA